jgi:glycogen debranching enzyme
VTAPIDVDPHHGEQILHDGYTVLLCSADGAIEPGTRHGLYDYDTRILSRYELLVDGGRPQLNSTGNLDAAKSTSRFTVPRKGGTPEGPQLPQDVLELVRRRRLGNGLEEHVELINHGGTAITCSLTLSIDSDFRDLTNVDQRGDAGMARIRRRWDSEARVMTIDFRAASGAHRLRRGMRLRVLRADAAIGRRPRMLSFSVSLPPGATWIGRWVFESWLDDAQRWRSPIDDEETLNTRARIAADWRRGRTTIESEPSLAGEVLERAAEDLIALRNWEYDTGPDAWIPNAGLPTYTGLFGRDVLTAGWQSALITPEIMRGALSALAATQATEDSAWHDAEPGKMIHEMRRGPLSELDVIPQLRYYGTQTSSSFFVVTLSELWHWTGDDELLRTYRNVALRTFEWAEKYGDLDGDDFLEYRKRSPRGLRNQGWKDSDEAIRHVDGVIADPPIATIEEQAYHWLALRRMAEILLVLGEDARSSEFLERADRLQNACQQSFWMNEDGFYAMALDGAKRPVRSVGSNPGHALAAGLVPIALARQVADRLMAADLFSGWGIRTLSTEHPSYNPFAYHLGAVWPVETASIALGFTRYGLDDHLERLAAACFAAAARFRHYRLPEALGGHSRDESAIPSVYPSSNSPQAWSASAIVQVAQAMLGLYPFAPAHLLALVRPRLPLGIRRLTLRNLRVGDSRVSIVFRREGDLTRHELIEGSGPPLHVLEVPPPQSTAATDWTETVKTWLLRHAPGRTAEAIRIALGPF